MFPNRGGAYKYEVMVSTLIFILKTIATSSLITKGTRGVWKAKHSQSLATGGASLPYCINTNKNAYFLYSSASMATATANAGIMFTNIFRIRLICHELGYVKILLYVPLIFYLANSNNWYHSHFNLVMNSSLLYHVMPLICQVLGA